MFSLGVAKVNSEDRLNGIGNVFSFQPGKVLLVSSHCDEIILSLYQCNR